MTVPATGSRWTYAGNAVTTAFSVNRKFIDETDLTVYLVDDTTGVGTAQVYGADYIVTGAGDPAGGTVTFTAAPDAGETVLIYRDTDRTQNASLDNVTALPMAALESSLDRAQLGIDELRTIVGRSARLDDSDPTDSLNAISKKAIRKSKVLGFDANGNFSYYERGQIADEYVSLVQNLRYYNPCDATWGATGDGVTDDLAIVQDCVNDLIADGGGILLINHKHALSGTLTIPAGAPVTIYSPAPYLGQFICTHGNDAVVIERTLVGTDAAPRVENLGIIKGSGASTGGIALKIAYDDINSGSYKGAVVRGCYFTRNGATYFNTGIDLTRCTHATIEECFIQGQGGTSSTKVGSGVNLNTWCQGLTVHNNKIRGFLNGLLISDISVDVSEDFQSEGYSIRGNSVTNCTNGLVSSITSTEVSWVVQANSFDCTKTGISLDNLIRVQIEENRFGWNGGHTDHADIVLRRTDGVSPTTSTMQNLVGKNRAFRKGDLELAVSGVTRGATTTITYTTVSKTRSITAISQGNPCVITYSGGDAFSDDDTVSLSGILGMTELNGYSGRIQNVNTGANTFELAGVDSTGFTAYVSGGSAALVSATGTLANDDVLYLYGIGGTTQLNGRPVKVASLNTGAGTFVAKDYETGADIASTAYGAYTSGGSIVRYGRFLEIKGGADIDALGNQITFRSVGLHLWANAKNVSWAQNRLVGKDGSSVIEAINNSSYQGTLTILPMGAAEYLVRDGGAPGDGVKDDTAFLQAVLTAGKSIYGDPAKTYRITESLVITADGTGFDGNGALLVMSTATGDFDNTAYANRAASNAVAITATGVDRPYIRNLRVTPSAWVDPSYLKAAFFDTCTGILIDGLEAYGFSRGSGLVTIVDSTNTTIRNSYFHDCWSNSTTVDGTYPTSSVQITGIEVDSNASTGSSGGMIENCVFENLTVGDTLRNARGYQTDGINFQGIGTTKPTKNWRVVGCRFYNLGEAIDVWGDDNTFIGNTAERCFAHFGKILFGASRNVFANNVIKDTGYQAFVISGSSSVSVNADANVIIGNKIYNVEISGDWLNAPVAGQTEVESYDASDYGGVAAWSASGTAGISIDTPSASPTSVVTNSLIAFNEIDLGGTGNRGIRTENNAGGSATNRCFGNVIRNIGTTAYSDAAGYLLIDGVTRPRTITGDATVANDDRHIINNKSGSGCTLTLPAAADYPNRQLTITNNQAQTVSSATSNVVPKTGGAAGTAILAATSGAWADLVSNGSNWLVVRAG